MSNSIVKAYNITGPNKHTPSSSFVLPDTFIGLEIELEPATPGSMVYSAGRANRAGWTITSDGSLRSGVEYVLSSPLLGTALEKAVTAFFDPATGGPVGWAASERTSTHIHLDMSQDTDTDEVLRNTMAMYYVLEPALFDLVGEGRKWCGYCNQFDDSDLTPLKAIMNGEAVRANFSRGRGRYYGANPRSLAQYGTIEFRIFPNPDNQAELMRWINLVMELKLIALKLADQKKTVEEEIQSHGIRRLLNDYGSGYLLPALEFIREEDVAYRAGVCFALRSNAPSRRGEINQDHPSVKRFMAKQSGQQELPDPESIPITRPMPRPTARELNVTFRSPSTLQDQAQAAWERALLSNNYLHNPFRTTSSEDNI